jgi:DNA polymerase I
MPIRWDDTLIAHHSYASHLPQRLDHVVSEYLTAPPWKISYGKRGTGIERSVLPKDLTAEDLCKYNAYDTYYTARIWEEMQIDLEAERAVYEHDLQLAEVCRGMIIEGLGVDTKRKDELSQELADKVVDIDRVLCSLTERQDFSPGKLGDVRWALFERFRTPFVASTPSGKRSTSNITLEVLKASNSEVSEFCSLLLERRGCLKAKNTYLDPVHINPNTGRTHYTWKVHGTVSGRLSGRLQSCPRYDPASLKDRVREIYIPRDRDHVFVYFDVSQAEMRLGAYLSGDPNFIAACGKDVHAGNAAAVFPEVAAKGWLSDPEAKKDPERGKLYRDIAKNLGFAICYGAEAQRVFETLQSKGFKVSYKAVELILGKLRAAYKVYYRYVESNLEAARQCGYIRSPIVGRIRWVGWYPSPTEVANIPVQSALADIMNLRTIDLVPLLPKRSKLVAQIHDACIFDCHREEASDVEGLIRDIWSKGIPLKGGNLILPIDMKRGERWSDL